MLEIQENCSEVHNSATGRIWDTSDVLQSEAFEFYRDGICSGFMPLRPERPKDRSLPFHSKHSSRAIGDVTLNMVTASAHPVFKGKAEIAASDISCYYLNLQLSGRCSITQAGETVELQSGHMAIFDSACPFALDHGEAESLSVVSLMIPKKLISNTVRGTPLMLSDNPVYGSALRQASIAFAPTVKSGDGDALCRLRDVVLGLVDLTLSNQIPDDRFGRRQNAQYFRLCELVRRHCTDSSIRIDAIAPRLGLSIGAARNIFTQHNDTFGRRLQKERVEVAKLLLSASQHAHLTAAEIGFRCGFSNEAHFGRTFKSLVGKAPGAWRKSAGRRKARVVS